MSCIPLYEFCISFTSLHTFVCFCVPRFGVYRVGDKVGGNITQLYIFIFDILVYLCMFLFIFVCFCISLYVFACKDLLRTCKVTRWVVTLHNYRPFPFTRGNYYPPCNWPNRPPSSIIIAFGQLSGDRRAGGEKLADRKVCFIEFYSHLFLICI